MKEKTKSIRKDKYADKPKLILTLFNNNNNVLCNINIRNIKIHKNNSTKFGRGKLSSCLVRPLHCLGSGKTSYLYHSLII